MSLISSQVVPETIYRAKISYWRLCFIENNFHSLFLILISRLILQIKFINSAFYTNAKNKSFVFNSPWIKQKYDIKKRRIPKRVNSTTNKPLVDRSRNENENEKRIEIKRKKRREKKIPTQPAKDSRGVEDRSRNLTREKQTIVDKGSWPAAELSNEIKQKRQTLAKRRRLSERQIYKCIQPIRNGRKFKNTTRGGENNNVYEYVHTRSNVYRQTLCIVAG